MGSSSQFYNLVYKTDYLAEWELGDLAYASTALAHFEETNSIESTAEY